MPMTESITRGAITTADRVSNSEPEQWYKQIYNQFNVGTAPMTAISQRMNRVQSSSRVFHWWEMPPMSAYGSILDVYTNAALSSAYTTGGVSGTILYLATTGANAKLVRAGDTLLIVTATTGSKRRVDVMNVVVASDTTSYIACKLMETDTSNTLAEATPTFRVIGNSQSELSELPMSLFREPTELYNYTQIFMESLEFSGTELAEEERITPGKYKRAKADAFQRLRRQMENAALWGVRGTGTGANGKQKRFTGGLYSAISTYASTNIYNYTTDSDSAYAGKAWLVGGWPWLKEIFLELNRYSTSPSGGAADKVLYCGDLAWLAINDLVEDAGLYTISGATTDYGLRVRTLKGLQSDVHIYQHPLLAADTAFRRSALIYEPACLDYIYLKGRDMTFIPRGESKNGFTWVDGIKEGWMAEIGFRYHNLDCCGWLDGLGTLNTQ